MFTIITDILKGEDFSIDELARIQIVSDHMMLHDGRKEYITKRFASNITYLIFSMFTTNWHVRVGPLNLIQLYFGEKYALYIAFILHHAAMLIVLTIVGATLFGYQVYLAVYFGN